MEQKPGTTLKIFGWLSAMLLLLGNFFKMMHWPFAGAGIIVGCLFFILFYLPLWISAALKDKEGRVIKIIQFITLFLYGTTSLWKMMHWPGGGMLYYVMYGYTLIFLVPYSIYLLIRTGKRSLTGFHVIIVLFLILTNSTSALSNAVSSNVVEEFAYTSAAVERSLIKAEAKNERLYKVLDFIPEKQNNISLQTASVLKELSDSAAAYVHAFRSDFISRLEQVPIQFADTMSVTEVRRKTDKDIANRMIVGNEFALNSGRYSGLELKKMIEWYRDTVVTLLQSENKELVKASINLETEGGKDADGAPVHWVVYYFYNVPALTTITNLNGIELEIRNAESQVLSDLVNTASRNASGDIARKVVEMGDKLEKEKQEKQIALLQKESELSELRMNAKNAELEAVNRTVTWFVFGLLICSVMLFFIIRSNLMRKKINRELEVQKKIIEQQKTETEHQKELVEEKQKEIIDSIKYAQRIQRSLLPSEKYIDKTIRKTKS